MAYNRQKKKCKYVELMERPRRQMRVQADMSKVPVNRQAGKQDDKQVTQKTGMSSFMQVYNKKRKSHLHLKSK